MSLHVGSNTGYAVGTSAPVTFHELCLSKRFFGSATQKPGEEDTTNLLELIKFEVAITATRSQVIIVKQ